jgi:hypothetical protein
MPAQETWPVTERERQDLLRAMLKPFAEAMILVTKQYKVNEQAKEGG